MRSTIKRNTIDFYIEKLNDFGFTVDCIKVFSTAGDIRPPYPYQYQAVTEIRPCDDDVFYEEGWTPLEAVKNLYKSIKGMIDISQEDDIELLEVNK